MGGKATFGRRTGVGSHPTALVEDFEGLFGRPNVNFLAAEGVGHPEDSCTEETMYRFAVLGETKKSELNDGDIAGINELYQ